MKHSTYINGLGTVTYEESFFLGRKKVHIDDIPCGNIDKTQYTYIDKEGNKKIFNLKGNFLLGVTIEENSQVHTIIGKPKWYEIAIVAFIFAFTLVWGNSVNLVKILPIFGGAVGGAIGGVFAAGAMIAMRTAKKTWLKILIGIGIFATSILVNSLLAMAFLSALA